MKPWPYVQSPRRPIVVGSLMAGTDGRVRLIDLETRKTTKSDERHAGMVQSVSFSPDSTQLASGGRDGILLLRSLSPLQPTAELSMQHSDSVWCIRYSPDGRKVASCDRRVIRIRDFAARSEFHISVQAWSLAWSTSFESCFLLAGCIDGTLRRFDPDTGRILTTCKAHQDVISSIALPHNANFIATASWDKTVRFWEATTFQEIAPCLQHDVNVHSISISPSDKYLVSGARDPIVRVWNLRVIAPALFGPVPLKLIRVRFNSFIPGHAQIHNLISHHRKVCLVSPSAKFIFPPTIPPLVHIHPALIALQPPNILSFFPLVDPRGMTQPQFNRPVQPHGAMTVKVRSHSSDLSGKIIPEENGPVAYGNHGDIYRGVLNIDGGTMRVAIKVFKEYMTQGDNKSKKRRLRRATKIWRTLEHRNVLPFLGTSTDYGAFEAMVCPWVENGALATYLESHEDELTEQQRFGIINDVALGLQYLHSHSVVHGDISGTNVLIDESGSACIADFGLSMVLTRIRDGVDVPIKRDPPLHGPRVTILTGKIPYHYLVDGKVILAISKAEYPRRPKSGVVDGRTVEFMTKCWSSKPMNRPSDADMVAFVMAQMRDAIMDARAL
ncbi:WD40-repeat-containing domain protein [Chiua virens]|nr:WD40-repeat-containing domain protein [Chiua virens]